MKPIRFFLLATVMLSGSTHASLITWNSIVEFGEINGTDVTGETVELIVDFTDNQVFSANGTISLSDATSSLNLPDSFGILDFDDPAFDNVLFGEAFSNFFIISLSSASSGTNGDNNEGLLPVAGESISNFFTRVGDGTTINFTADNRFAGPRFGTTFNGGAFTATQEVRFNFNSPAAVTFNASVNVPEPSAFALLVIGLFGMGMVKRIKKV